LNKKSISYYPKTDSLKTFTMKKIAIAAFLICFFGTIFAFNILQSDGQVGKTGSPGEDNCSGCHDPVDAASSISLSANPSFVSNRYEPSTTYTITITVSHPSLQAFGFDCEILDPSNENAGIMSNPGPGMQFAEFSGKQNATHTAPKAGSGSASWTFVWTSPEGGIANFYLSGLAADLSESTSGDSPANTVVMLTASPGTGVKQVKAKSISPVIVFPNPVNDIASVTYQLLETKNISITLLDIKGREIRTLVNERQHAGPHSNIIDLKGIEGGVYFLKTTADGIKISQKLITLQ
jgi:hypothetical protein